ncbi:MAG: hypothetical protein HOF23_05045 [Rhodospirillaceae bacterium]|nr:hypothetical protein [Rhodospirillaceae bacterium]
MNEKTKSLILIIGAITLAIVFIAFGAGKFIDPSKWETKFEAWGENGGDKIVHRSGGISLPWAE